jgi:hypothetical protein
MHVWCVKTPGGTIWCRECAWLHWVEERVWHVANKVYKNAGGITFCRYSVCEDTGYRFDVLIITIYPAVKLLCWGYPMTCLCRHRGEEKVYLHPTYRLALGGGGWWPRGSTPSSSQTVGCFECGNECDCNFLLECCALQCGINLLSKGTAVTLPQTAWYCPEASNSHNHCHEIMELCW